MNHYDASWMHDENLPVINTKCDYCLVPDVDITEETYIFDSDDAILIHVKF